MLRDSLQNMINFYYSYYIEEFRNLDDLIQFCIALNYEINVIFKQFSQ